MAGKKKYYAVAVGKVPGIYTQWFGANGAEVQVRGFAGAVYKGFATLSEAERFMKSPPSKRRRRTATGKNVSKPNKKLTKKSAPKQIDEKGKIVIYTDGGALNNPGPGGYGVVIANGTKRKELSKGFRLTTNNRMELLACIEGLKAVKKPSDIILYSDSKYVVDGITKGWAKKWRANGWMRTKKEPAINPDLWDKLLNLCNKHDVTFSWVKGHAGIEGNERCDTLATRSAAKANLAIDVVYEKRVS